MNDVPTSQKAAVLKRVANDASTAVSTLQELIRIDSSNPPGNERAMADACADIARTIGFDVLQVEAAPGRVSNICRMAGSGSGPTLMFNSHLDTFPPGDVAAWQYPPHSATIADGQIWGLGSRNMKAGLAAALMAAKAVVESHVPLSGTLVLTQTADEIQGGHQGWEHLLKTGVPIHADYGVYTEANPPLKVEIAARGLIHYRVTVSGYAKHSKYKVEKSTSGQPVNAIAKMTSVIDALEAMEFDGWTPHALIPGPPFISVNRIEGGFSDSMIPDRCSILADCRILPGQEPADVTRQLEHRLSELMAEDPALRVALQVQRTARPVAVDAASPIVGKLQAAIREVVGHELPLGGVGSASDMRWIVLDAGIPMCKFMFASSESGTNEHEAIADYIDTIRVYATLILNELA